jgi:hypothetical protein
VGPTISVEIMEKIILPLPTLDVSDHPVRRLISITTTLSQLILFFSGTIYYKQLKILSLPFNKSQSLRRGIEFWASIFTLKFGTSKTSQLSVLLAQSHFTPKETP